MTPILAPTCFDCVHAQINAGRPGDRWEPGEEASCDCGLYEQQQDYFDELFDGQNDPAHKCVHFQPILARNCANCGKEINQPAWCWPLFFVGIYGSQPACSESCRTTLEQAENQSLGEL